MDFHNKKAAFAASCDNQGMIRKCISNPPHRLCLHREANTDLFLVQHFYSNHINAQCHWVKGHTDKESWETLEQLKNQKISTEETFNVWRDRLASNEWKNETHLVYDPDVPPQEQWGIYSNHPTYHKLLGNMSTDLANALSWESTATYIKKKHGL